MESERGIRLTIAIVSMTISVVYAQGSTYNTSDKFKVDFKSDTGVNQKDDGKIVKLVNVSHVGAAEDRNKVITLSFNQSIDKNTIKHIRITEGASEKQPIGGSLAVLNGQWILSKDNTIATFKPDAACKAAMFYSISIPEEVKSADGVAFSGGKDIASFITDNGENHGRREVHINPLKVIDGNNIPLIISLPKTQKKHPVLIYVHGGGWTGGTRTESIASLPMGYSANYLVEKLGVALVGVAYRCRGSNGNFSKALEDVKDAVKYLKAHASDYNLDMTRLGIGGGSAGAPLAALISQQDPDIRFFIGWNGMYDFVNDGEGRFGKGNAFGQETPSAAANSAIFNIRQNPPQTILLHGTNDGVISHLQSANYHNAIVSAGGKSTLLLYDGQPHWNFYAPGGKYELSTLYQVKEFLKEALDNVATNK